jgi:UDP-N-acetylglucosamine 2-epimerase (non-hydrolysing)
MWIGSDRDDPLLVPRYMPINRPLQVHSFGSSAGAILSPLPQPRIMVVVGTRPEAIKLCPVILALRKLGLRTAVCASGQHREMVKEVFEIFGVDPDFELDVLEPNQTLSALTSRLVGHLGSLVEQAKPSMLVVQGDTSTALCAALVAFYHRISVAHVEAGLRTFDRDAPFPEEMNRRLITQITNLHFAPTDWAAENLKNEGIPATSILVSGNPGTDAVLMIREALKTGRMTRDLPRLSATKKVVLVTAHRRESFGHSLQQICIAVSEIAERPDVEVVWPVHPNPNVRQTVRCILASGTENLHLIEPLNYLSFVDLMMRSYILLTDSGGIQEEGSALGRPVLVMRSKTDRPEALLAGTSRIVDTHSRTITESVGRLLDNASEYQLMAKACRLYGDGRASVRIAKRIASDLGCEIFKSEDEHAARSPSLGGAAGVNAESRAPRG